jgi:riboflavin kinase/FMN adenylyltransferase
MVTRAPSGEFVRTVGDLPRRHRGAVVAIGNFDGMHRGHQGVLAAALAEAERRAAPALILTFEPHPREVFRPETPLFRLTPAPLRAALAAALGFDGIVEQPFDAAFASMPAGEFVTEYLGKRLAAAHVVTGEDFHFGRGREGAPRFLAETGRAAGIGVSAIAAVQEAGAPVSSSRVRAALGEGKVETAAALLGYRFTVEAAVGDGRRLGRTLGFPTANMALPPAFGLRHGVYAAMFRRASGASLPGVASFGLRPTVDSGGAPLLETFLFDFSGDLYGETCRVSFFAFLRPEEKFSDMSALTAAMRNDEARARAIMAKAAPLTALDAAFVFGAP